MPPLFPLSGEPSGVRADASPQLLAGTIPAARLGVRYSDLTADQIAALIAKLVANLRRWRKCQYHDAHDLAVDAVLEWCDEGDPLASVVITLTRRAADRWRTIQRRRRRERSGYDFSPVPTRRDEQSLRFEAEDALHTLPKTHRTIVVLHAIEGLTYEQIADRCCRTPACVQHLYREAIEWLRERFQES